MAESAEMVAIATGIGDVQVRSGSCRLLGWSARESATVAAAATAILRDGTSASGTPVAYIELAANESVSGGFPFAIPCGNGLFLDRVLGETEVTVFLG